MPTYDPAAAAADSPDVTGVPGEGASLPPELTGAARAFFGDRLSLAVEYAEFLATDGVARGLIGPREAPRIWERHLFNCAAIAELIPLGATLIDVGSGAGLPGIVLAVARPDLGIVLVEPLARRTAFLTEAVTGLGLEGSVTVLRRRAEDCVGPAGAGEVRLADIVTARAVAPLDRLAGWCLPLTAVGGRVLALKGASALSEVEQHQGAVGRLGGAAPVIRRCGRGLVDPPTTVVEIVRARPTAMGRSGGKRRTVPGRPARSRHRSA